MICEEVRKLVNCGSCFVSVYFICDLQEGIFTHSQLPAVLFVGVCLQHLDHQKSVRVAVSVASNTEVNVHIVIPVLLFSDGL
jgi:hypothetical protein